jgi:hypothetical protein
VLNGIAAVILLPFAGDDELPSAALDGGSKAPSLPGRKNLVN